MVYKSYITIKPENNIPDDVIFRKLILTLIEGLPIDELRKVFEITDEVRVDYIYGRLRHIEVQLK